MARHGFSYEKTDFIYLSFYENNKWDEGQLSTDDHINISLMSTVLHYGQTVFEGLKAYRRKDGKIQLFRVADNARRFMGSCERIVMPTFPEERFIKAVKEVVLANEKYVPKYKEGTLYIRPVMFGVGHNLGLRPAANYVFAIIVSPVGSYFDSAQKGVHLITSDYDRAAPYGTGKAKTGGNYAASLLPQKKARSLGYADVLFLDPKTHGNIEEVGAANFIGITKDHVLYTPKSSSILDGITKRSILYLAKNELHMKIEEKMIPLDDLEGFVEAAACGTAAVITPIASVTHNDKTYKFLHHESMGPITSRLYDLLTGIQFGDIEDPDEWITFV